MACMEADRTTERLQSLAVDDASIDDTDLEPQAEAEADDMDDDMDSEELRQDLRAYGIQQLLPLEDDDGSIDADALEYLRRGRREVACMPAVCVSSINARAYDDQRTTSYVDASDDRAAPYPDPDFAWTCQVIDDFVAARAEVFASSRRSPPPPALGFPIATDRQAWARLVSASHFQPFSSTLACMDGALVATLIAFLASEARRLGCLSAHAGLWLYGLMVRLEKPVHGSVAATLRDVNRMARERTAGTAAAGAVASDAAAGAGGADPAAVAMHDTLLVLAGGFFGQDPQLCGVVDQYVRQFHPALAPAALS